MEHKQQSTRARAKSSSSTKKTWRGERAKKENERKSKENADEEAMYCIENSEPIMDNKSMEL
jgi:hypothetical protein